MVHPNPLPAVPVFVLGDLRLGNRESSSGRPAAVAFAADLGTALPESDRQALYLRTFLRLLSSWVLPTDTPTVSGVGERF